MVHNKPKPAKKSPFLGGKQKAVPRGVAENSHGRRSQPSSPCWLLQISCKMSEDDALIRFNTNTSLLKYYPAHVQRALSVEYSSEQMRRSPFFHDGPTGVEYFGERRSIEQCAEWLHSKTGAHWQKVFVEGNADSRNSKGVVQRKTHLIFHETGISHQDPKAWRVRWFHHRGENTNHRRVFWQKFWDTNACWRIAPFEKKFLFKSQVLRDANGKF